jgi:hypothetical protein
MVTKKKPKAKKDVVKKTPVKVISQIAEPPKTLTNPFMYVGQDGLVDFLPGDEPEISVLVKKFQNRYGVKLHYLHKFRAFKLYRRDRHVDWITLNDLMKRYDCRIPPVKMNTHPQRPFKKDRVY